MTRGRTGAADTFKPSVFESSKTPASSKVYNLSGSPRFKFPQISSTTDSEQEAFSSTDALLASLSGDSRTNEEMYHAQLLGLSNDNGQLHHASNLLSSSLSGVGRPPEEAYNALGLTDSGISGPSTLRHSSSEDYSGQNAEAWQLPDVWSLGVDFGGMPDFSFHNGAHTPLSRDSLASTPHTQPNTSGETYRKEPRATFDDWNTRSIPEPHRLDSDRFADFLATEPRQPDLSASPRITDFTASAFPPPPNDTFTDRLKSGGLNTSLDPAPQLQTVLRLPTPRSYNEPLPRLPIPRYPHETSPGHPTAEYDSPPDTSISKMKRKHSAIEHLSSSAYTERNASNRFVDGMRSPQSPASLDQDGSTPTMSHLSPGETTYKQKKAKLDKTRSSKPLTLEELVGEDSRFSKVVQAFCSIEEENKRTVPEIAKRVNEKFQLIPKHYEDFEGVKVCPRFDRPLSVH